jgi:hypothetical protein
MHAAGEAWQAYHQQLDERLTTLPADLAHGISPDAIARAIAESLRQQFVQSGVPATADVFASNTHGRSTCSVVFCREFVTVQPPEEIRR